jgi:zinc protease
MINILRVLEGVFINTILIILLVSPGLFAADETLPTPEEIIAKNIEAMGGIKALKKIKNIKIVTIKKHVQWNIEIKITEYRERPNNVCMIFRVLGEGSSGKMEWLDEGLREGSNGKIAWDVNSNPGTRLIEGDSLAAFLREHSVDGPDGPDARYKSMKTEGIEQINGKDCYKVVKTLEQGFKRAVFYDKKSYMIVKTSGLGQGNRLFEVYNEGYKKINGILFPYKEVSFLNGKKNVEITYETIELNTEMPEGIFDIPEEVKAIMNKNETEPHAQQ